jgi:hypothetical protein
LENRQTAKRFKLAQNETDEIKNILEDLQELADSRSLNTPSVPLDGFTGAKQHQRRLRTAIMTIFDMLNDGLSAVEDLEDALSVVETR